MPRTTQRPQPQQIHFVDTPQGMQLYASKFLPMTDLKPARLKYWRINFCLDMIGEPTVKTWSYERTAQAEELQICLGPEYHVINQSTTFSLLEKALNI